MGKLLPDKPSDAPMTREEYQRRMAEGCEECHVPEEGIELPDMVNHPPHYTQGGIECIDAIRAALTEEEWRGYCKGNAIKYVWRERHKGGGESLAKACWYLERI